MDGLAWTSDASGRRLVSKAIIFGMNKDTCNPQLQDFIDTRLSPDTRIVLSPKKSLGEEERDSVIAQLEDRFDALAKMSASKVELPNHLNIASFVASKQLEKHAVAHMLTSWLMEKAEKIDKNRKKINTKLSKDDLYTIANSELGFLMGNRIHNEFLNIQAVSCSTTSCLSISCLLISVCVSGRGKPTPCVLCCDLILNIETASVRFEYMVED